MNNLIKINEKNHYWINKIVVYCFGARLILISTISISSVCFNKRTLAFPEKFCLRKKLFFLLQDLSMAKSVRVKDTHPEAIEDTRPQTPVDTLPREPRNGVTPTTTKTSVNTMTPNGMTTTQTSVYTTTPNPVKPPTQVPPITTTDRNVITPKPSVTIINSNTQVINSKETIVKPETTGTSGNKCWKICTEDDDDDWDIWFDYFLYDSSNIHCKTVCTNATALPKFALGQKI